MADFRSHIAQSIHNFEILEQLNSKISKSTDWQITVCFYTALHLIDAYLAKEANLHYNKHSEVRRAIWFDEPMSPHKLPEAICMAYRSLENLSRKSRYLCSDIDERREREKGVAHIVREKDLIKALRNCSLIIQFFSNKYPSDVIFPTIRIVSKEVSVGQTLPFVQF